MVKRIAIRLKPVLYKLWQKMAFPSPPNLLGERDIEHSWGAANMPDGPGSALDFGSGTTWMGLLAARKGFEVLSIDLTAVEWYYSYEALEFRQTDVFNAGLAPNSLDLVINCSTIEHVGLKGRYKTKSDRAGGDIECIRLLKALLKPGKQMIMTIPVGRDDVFPPYHRVYGPDRLAALLEGWEVSGEEYWAKDPANKWQIVSKEEALQGRGSDHYYNLGLFVLTRPGDAHD